MQIACLREVIVRKSDIEYVEMLLAPLRATADRHESSLNGVERATKEWGDRLGELERDRDANSLSVEQAITSVRSLLQRAHRKMRESGDLEPEPEPQGEPEVDNGKPAPHAVRQHAGRFVL